MSFNLKVVTFKGRPPEEPLTITFGREGGTIGRSKKNSLVLPDPNRYISRQHAVILCENDSYYFKDTSLAGSYIRNKQMLLHQNKIKLEDGDRIEIGDYELLAGIGGFVETQYSSDQISIQGEGNHSSDLIYEFSDNAAGKLDPEPESQRENKYGDFEAAVKFIDKKMQEAATEPDGEPENLSFNYKENSGMPFDDMDGLLPLDLDELLPDDVSPLPPHDTGEPFCDDIGASLPDKIKKSSTDEHKRSEASPDHEGRSSPSDEDVKDGSIKKNDHISNNGQSVIELFQIFLQAAGIEDNNFCTTDEIYELMKTAGAVFRELVEGLSLLINGRAEAKNQLRLAGTILGPVDNNPFKFSSNMEEILKSLLCKKQEGFISGIQAVRDSHADIIGHQLAMTVGISAALKKALKRFDPALYMERHKKGVLSLRKIKCWDAYCNDYNSIVIKTLENFLDDEFVRAYEAQIERLDKAKSKS